MRTGFNMLDENEDSIDPQLMLKISSIMQVLMEEAVKTAARFSATCGRSDVMGADVVIALKYETHEFFNKPNIENRYFEILQEPMDAEDNEDSDDNDENIDEDENENSDESDSESSEHDDTSNINITETCPSLEYVTGDREFYDKAINYSRTWRNWNPDDQIKCLLKRSIDKTEIKLGAIEVP